MVTITSRSRKVGIALLGGVLLSGSLAACGSSGSSSASGSCAGKNKTLNMAFIYATTTQNPFQEMALGAKQAAEDDGNVKLKELAPTGVDGPASVAQFQSVIRQAKDGIAYETVTPDLFVRALNQATDAKVPVVAVDAAPPKGTKVATYVGNSNTDLGTLLGDAFVASKPPSGQVVIGNDIPSLPLLGQRIAGLTAVIKSKLPNNTIAGPFNSQSEPTANYNAWNSIVSSHQSAVAFIGVGGQDGVSLPKIKQQTGKTFLAGSADLPPEALQAVQQGSLFALSSPEHWMKGYIAMHLLIKAARTCKAMPTGWWNSGNLLVDKSNVAAIIARQKDEKSRDAYFKPVIAKQLANPPVKPLSDAN